MDPNRMIISEQTFMRHAMPLATVAAQDLSSAAFQTFVHANRPCLIKGAADHWPALTHWVKSDYLIERTLGQTVSFYPHVNYQTVARHHRGRERVAFAEAWARLCDPSEAAVAIAWAITNIAAFPAPEAVYRALKDDIPGYRFLPSPIRALVYPAWRGFLSRNAGTGWHFHQTDCTLMTQVEGTKTIGLLPPDRRTFDIVKDDFTSDACFDDPSRFGDAEAQLRAYVAVVEKGDAVFIPPYWWHGVESGPGLNITVPFCWRAPLHVLGAVSLPANRSHWRSLAPPWQGRHQARALVLSSLGLIAAAGRFPRLSHE